MNIASTDKPFEPLLRVMTLSALLLAWLMAMPGCDGEPVPPAPAPPPSTRVSTAADAADASTIRIVILGDSITAGLGLSADQAYPALMQEQLADQGIGVDIVNAGVSGDTTAGGLRRVDWLLRQSPDILVIALGGNDGLRAQQIPQSKANLKAIIRKAQEAHAKVLLLGMHMPPNYGQAYTDQFKAIYHELAQEMNVPLMPFLLQDVGGHPDLNQPDGIHPTARGQQIIAANVLPYLKKMIHDLPAKTKTP